jgi:cytochrome c-type biogenesis protein CcmH/NrfF
MPFSRNSGGRFPRLLRLAQTLLVAGAVCLSLYSTVGATDAAGRFDDLGNKLMCTCGCQQILAKCDHVGCTYRGEEMDMLRSGIANGQNDSLILQSFVQRYGATVLAAPTTQGFDLVAWIMPFAVAAAGLIGTIFLVLHWSKQQAAQQGVPATAGKPKSIAQVQADEAMRERIRRETGTDGGF